MTTTPAPPSTTDVRAAARAAYVERQLLARRTVQAVGQAWQQIDPDYIRATWAAQVGPQVVRTVTDAQRQAAQMGITSVATILAAQGVTTQPSATVSADALAGIASSGFPLAELLERSNMYALRAIAQGRTAKQGLAVGGQWLQLAAGLQVVDAGRVAAGVTLTSRRVSGYVRMLNLPSCSRCIVLAGKFYRWNAGFERHPRCDCIHIPAGEDAVGDLRTDPDAVFKLMTQAEQDKTFGKAGAQAIRDGADIAQVVNARSGMRTASIGGRKVLTTTSGTGRRSYYSAVRNRVDGKPRLMPEQIYRIAGGNRAEALRLLAGNGYIVGDIRDVARLAL